MLVSIVLTSSFPEAVAIKREITGAVDTRVEESERNAARLEPVERRMEEERKKVFRIFCFLKTSK